VVEKELFSILLSLNIKIMADTIITNTPDSRDDNTGVVWVVIIAVLVVGAILLYRSGTFQTVTEPSSSEATEINVTIPAPVTAPAPAE